MAKPYAQLRARMSEDAQRQACDRARALLEALQAPAPDARDQGQATRVEDDTCTFALDTPLTLVYFLARTVV